MISCGAFMVSNIKVLLADDSRFFRAIESKFLQTTPVEILEADNCHDALSLVRSECPDLIYLYFGLPDEGGDYCCRKIKGDVRLRSIPVVMICDNDAPDQVSTAQAAGCDSFLVKPLDRLSFLHVGRQFLEVIREHRQPSFFPLKFSKGGEDFRGKCLDISGGGLFIETTVDMAVGELLNLDFKLPDLVNTQVLCSGEVMWLNRRPNPTKAHYPNGLGVKFLNLPDNIREAIMKVSGK